MVVFVTLLFILSFSATSFYSITQTLDKKIFLVLLNLTFIQHFSAIVLGLLFSFFMFYLVYKIVPHGKMNTRVALVSSLCASVLWEILKYGFTIYLVYFSNFTAVYGTYAAIVSLVFWIYYSSVIFVIGAEIGQLYNARNVLKVA
jgi:membrane protein